MEAEFKQPEPGPGGSIYSLVRVEGWLGGWVAGLGVDGVDWLAGWRCGVVHVAKVKR